MGIINLIFMTFNIGILFVLMYAASKLTTSRSSIEKMIEKVHKARECNIQIHNQLLDASKGSRELYSYYTESLRTFRDLFDVLIECKGFPKELREVCVTCHESIEDKLLSDEIKDLQMPDVDWDELKFPEGKSQ